MAGSQTGTVVGDKYWIKVVTLFFLGWVMMYATRTVFNPIMGVVGKEFNLDNTQLGLANSIFFLTYAIAQIPSGMLGDKFGRKLTIGIGFLLMAVLTYFSGIAATFSVFLIYRAIAGLGQGAYYGPQYALSTESIPSSKLTLGTAIINSGMAFGISGGFILSSKLVLEQQMNWGVPFMVTAVPAFIIGLLFFTLLKEKVIRPEDKDKVNTQQNSGEPVPKASLKSIFSNKNLLASFILCFCSIYAYFVVITWLPKFLIDERGFTGDVGFIASLVPWASIPGALIFAKLVDKFGKTKNLVYILLPVSIISLFLSAFVTDTTILIVVLIIYGLTGKLALDPILVSYVARNAPKGSLSTTLSAYNFIGMSGSILAPFITGYLADAAGSMQIGFYVASLLLLVGLIVFSSMAKELPAKQ